MWRWHCLETQKTDNVSHPEIFTFAKPPVAQRAGGICFRSYFFKHFSPVLGTVAILYLGAMPGDSRQKAKDQKLKNEGTGDETQSGFRIAVLQNT